MERTLRSALGILLVAVSPGTGFCQAAAAAARVLRGPSAAGVLAPIGPAGTLSWQGQGSPAGMPALALPVGQTFLPGSLPMPAVSGNPGVLRAESLRLPQAVMARGHAAAAPSAAREAAPEGGGGHTAFQALEAGAAKIVEAARVGRGSELGAFDALRQVFGESSGAAVPGTRDVSDAPQGSRLLLDAADPRSARRRGAIPVVAVIGTRVREGTIRVGGDLGSLIRRGIIKGSLGGFGSVGWDGTYEELDPAEAPVAVTPGFVAVRLRVSVDAGEREALLGYLGAAQDYRERYERAYTLARQAGGFHLSEEDAKEFAARVAQSGENPLEAFLKWPGSKESAPIPAPVASAPPGHKRADAAVRPVRASESGRASLATKPLAILGILFSLIGGLLGFAHFPASAYALLLVIPLLGGMALALSGLEKPGYAAASAGIAVSALSYGAIMGVGVHVILNTPWYATVLAIAATVGLIGLGVVVIKDRENRVPHL